MAWTESKDLEKSILLCIHKNPLSITDIAKETKRAKPTISKTIERMENQELIIKTHDYKKDARKSKISINPKRVKIEKSYMFYLTYYILISISLIISGISSLIVKNPLFIFGSIIVALPVFLMMIYEVFTKEDKIVVYKNPKLTKKENKEEIKTC